jgi:hypothetical protein
MRRYSSFPWIWASGDVTVTPRAARHRNDLLKVIYWLTLLLLVIASEGRGMMAQSAQNTETVVRENMRAWQTELADVIKIGSKISEVERAMAGKYRDKATIRWGGSGSYALFYLIDDFIQVRVEFNIRNEVVSVPVVARKGPWIRQPDGELRVDPR